MNATLCLGTVQFGLTYGINNSVGMLEENDVFEMMAYAQSKGIECFDTAAAYGLSERRIGHYMKGHGDHALKLITKVKHDDEKMMTYESLESAFNHSLESLKVQSVYGLLLHTASMMHDPVARKFLSDMKAQGKCQKIGISAYHPEEVASIIEHWEIDLIQIPLNILDRRFYTSGVIEQSRAKGIEVHARSPFLQGLLLMEASKAEQKVPGSGVWIAKLNELLQKFQTNPIAFMLKYPTEVMGADCVVFGVDRLDQLKEIIEQYERVELPHALIKEIDENIQVTEDKILLPYLW